MTRANARTKDRDAVDAQWAELDELLAPAAFAPGDLPVDESLWRRIEAAVDSLDRGGRRGKIIRREQGWRQYSRDVQIKRLWDRDTFLLRCDPGGILPPHEHRKFEHCIVLEGDMIVGGETYRAGDYHGVPAGIAHREITSRTGLMMLVCYR